MSQSSTRNVKMGVCRAYYDGQDLGVTQGGVEVAVTTETHKVMIDQFGKTPINEYIMGRGCTVKIPMAETTLENMVSIMPGATLSQTGGVKATGTVTLGTNPTTAQNVVINGVTITFKTLAAAANEVTIGASATASVAALAAFLNASTDPALAAAQYTPAATVMTVTAFDAGVAGNTFTLAAGTVTAAAVSGATLASGADSTKKWVDVTTGIGSDLLALAKELRLHPLSKAANDKSDDFVIPLAGTGGALQFAYKVDSERVFNVEFTGYPDPVTGKLFTVGDNT